MFHFISLPSFNSTLKELLNEINVALFVPQPQYILGYFNDSLLLYQDLWQLITGIRLAMAAAAVAAPTMMMTANEAANRVSPRCVWVLLQVRYVTSNDVLVCKCFWLKFLASALRFTRIYLKMRIKLKSMKLHELKISEKLCEFNDEIIWKYYFMIF